MIRWFVVALVLCGCTALVAQETRTANNTSAVRAIGNANATPAETSTVPIRALLYPGATTKIFVRLMLWWGDEKHIDVGYRSDDERQIERQLAAMKSRGIDGAIVAWYGPGETPRNRALQHWLEESAERGFQMGVSVDVGAVKDCIKRGCDETAEVASLINYVVDHYASSRGYWRVGGRPVVTFFGMEKHDIDWRRVRGTLNGNPMLIFRNSGAFNVPESDGGFAWIAPETVKAGDQIGEEYLERFYQKAKQSGKFTIGAAYKGFDDSMASWGKGKRIDQRCGQTWLDTFAIINKNYSSSHQLDAVIIPTWNDYEEGTAIEPGIATCVRLETRLDGDTLQWRVNGPAETIDHFAILKIDGGRSQEVTQLPASEHKLRLRVPGTYMVEAVGRPSMQNTYSGQVRFVRKDD